jgi:hypothetical protein
MRFWSFSRPGLRTGAPISLSWMNEEPPDEAARTRSSFVYKEPE